MKNVVISNTSDTDWKRVDAMRDEDIDFSDCPEISPEMLRKAVIRHNLQPVPPKKQLTLGIDQDVLEWFKALGRNYKSQINALLRAYMETHKESSKEKSVRKKLTH